MVKWSIAWPKIRRKRVSRSNFNEFSIEIWKFSLFSISNVFVFKCKRCRTCKTFRNVENKHEKIRSYLKCCITVFLPPCDGIYLLHLTWFLWFLNGVQKFFQRQRKKEAKVLAQNTVIIIILFAESFFSDGIIFITKISSASIFFYHIRTEKLNLKMIARAIHFAHGLRFDCLSLVVSVYLCV